MTEKPSSFLLLVFFVETTVVQIKVPKVSLTFFYGNMGSFSQILSKSYFTLSLPLELKANFSLGNKKWSLSITQKNCSINIK